MAPASAVASKGPHLSAVSLEPFPEPFEVSIASLHSTLWWEDWEAILAINDSFSWDFKYQKGKMKTDKKEARNACDFYGQRLQKPPVVKRAQGVWNQGMGNIYVKARLQQMVVFVTKMKNEDT